MVNAYRGTREEHVVQVDHVLCEGEGVQVHRSALRAIHSW